MADTAKSPKNVNSPKSPTTTDVDEDKKDKPPKEIPVIQDVGFFQHDTGDTYEGEFEAKKKDHTAKMQGKGVYTTAEGDSYSGHWEADKLTANGLTIISFNDGSQFEGLIKEWGYTGRGQYTYPDGSVLSGDFVDNCPVGTLVLTDPNGHIWLGKAEQGYGWCEPVNHFYEMLETTQVRTKRRHKNVPNAEVQVSPRTLRKTSEGKLEGRGRGAPSKSTVLKASPSPKSPTLKKGSPPKASLTKK